MPQNKITVVGPVPQRVVNAAEGELLMFEHALKYREDIKDPDVDSVTLKKEEREWLLELRWHRRAEYGKAKDVTWWATFDDNGVRTRSENPSQGEEMQPPQEAPQGDPPGGGGEPGPETGPETGGEDFGME